MATKRADIRSKVSVDGAAFSQGLRKITGQAERFGKDMAARFATIFSAGMVTAAARGMFVFADSVQTMAEQSEVTVEQFQKMAFLAEKTGIKVEDITMSLKGLAMARDRALSGAAGNRDESMFARVGLSRDDVRAMNDSWTMFQKVINGMRGLRGLERMSIAQTLMSESGLKVLPLLNADLNTLIDRFERLGLAISNDDISKMANFKNSLSELALFAKSTASPALAELASDLQKLSDTFGGAGGARDIGKAWAEALKYIPSLYSIVNGVSRVVEDVQTVMGGGGRGPKDAKGGLHSLWAGTGLLWELQYMLAQDAKNFGFSTSGFEVGKAAKKASLGHVPATDALARIGGFVGRGNVRSEDYQRQTVTELKELNREARKVSNFATSEW